MTKYIDKTILNMKCTWSSGYGLIALNLEYNYSFLLHLMPSLWAVICFSTGCTYHMYMCIFVHVLCIATILPDGRLSV